MKRTFLGWNQPCIPTLLEHLLNRHRVGTSDFFDLSGYVLVFPNRAAGKRFLTVLADYAWLNHCTIEPPRVRQMGDFMELLYEQKAPCASLLTQQVLWMQALKQLHDELPHLFTTVFPNPPEKSDVDSWFLMGAQMAENFQNLARENLDFGQVFQLCQKLCPQEEHSEFQPDLTAKSDENSGENSDEKSNKKISEIVSRNPSANQESVRAESSSLQECENVKTSVPETYSTPSAQSSELDEMSADLFENEVPDDIFEVFRNEDPNRSQTESRSKSHLDSLEDADSGFFPYHEVRRWELLARAEVIYYSRLDHLGFWDRQAARLFALRNAQEPSFPGVQSKDFQISFQLGVVGCVDLSNLQRAFLRQVSSNVESFVFAPESMSDRFEEDGCLKQGKWRKLEPELNSRLYSVLTQVTKPEEEVQIVMNWLREIAPQTPIEDVTLGLVDESLEPLLLQSLSMKGVSCLRAGKKTLANLQPWKLLKRFQEYYQSIASSRPGKPIAELMDTMGPEYETLALFLRQEDVGNYLRSLRNEEGEPLISGDWIAELDAYFNQFYPSRMPVPATLAARQNRFPALFLAYQSIHTLLQDFARDYINFHSLLAIVTQFLKRIYCWKGNYDASDETEYQIIRGCMELNHAFSDKLQLPQALLADLDLNLPQALGLLLSQTASKQMPTSSPPETISIQRWLDLPLDDAPAMAVMGVNENFIPESVTEDVFLPNQLRQKLDLRTNENRFERDVYNLSAILASRKSLCVTLGRISTKGDTLFPSRLLLTEDSKTLIDHVIQLFEEPGEPELAIVAPLPPEEALAPEEDLASEGDLAPEEDLASEGDLAQKEDLTSEKDCATKKNSATKMAETLQKSGLFLPPNIPNELPPITEMAVTDFSVFITNPYLFYLQRFLRLQKVDDSAKELKATDFGTLFHDVMEAFGKEEIQRRTELGDSVFNLHDETALTAETERIQTRLMGLLNQFFFARFGSQALPVATIQREQLQERLVALAAKQAEQYRDGWRIWAVERPVTTYLRENGGAGDVLHFQNNGPKIRFNEELSTSDSMTNTMTNTMTDTMADTMLVRGKLDRIDFRQLPSGTTEWRIWDYKTSGDTPDKKHFNRQSVPNSLLAEDWKDLQLPLYRHLIRAARLSHEARFEDLRLVDPTHLKVGYILVPKKTGDTQFLAADWDETIFQCAEEKILEIAQAVYQRELPNNHDLFSLDRGTELDWILNPK